MFGKVTWATLVPAVNIYAFSRLLYLHISKNVGGNFTIILQALLFCHGKTISVFILQLADTLTNKKIYLLSSLG